MTREQVAVVLALFAGAWPRCRADAHTTRVWCDLLADEPDTCWQEAARSLAREDPDREFPPSPALYRARRRELARSAIEEQRTAEARAALPEPGVMPAPEARAQLRVKLNEALPRIRLLPGSRPRPQIIDPEAPRCRACGAPTDARDDQGPCHPWCVPFDAAYAQEPRQEASSE